MVNFIYAILTACLGFLAYLLIAFVGSVGTAGLRHRIAHYYWGLATRAMGKIAIVRRSVGSYSLMKLKVDDEKGAGKVVLDDSLLGDSKGLYFDDPDNRIDRVKSKPVAVLQEDVPGVVDPELAELGYHWRNHYSDGKHRAGEDGEQVNPYFDVDGRTRLVNIDDVKPLILNGSEPTDAGTIEDFTEKRFEKYGGGVGATEVLSALTGFGTGLIGMAVVAYVRDDVLDGGVSTPGDPAPVFLGPLADAGAYSTDLAVLLL